MVLFQCIFILFLVSSVCASIPYGPLSGTLAPPVCAVDRGGETKERELVLCERTRYDDGSALSGTVTEAFYVTASGFGAFRISDYERSGKVRRRFRTWANVSAQPVTGTSGCVVASDGTLWAYVALAPSVYAAVNINMTTLSVLRFGMPYDFVSSAGVQIKDIGAAAWDPLTQTLFVATESVSGTMPTNFSPILLVYHAIEDTSEIINYDITQAFGVDVVDMTDARISSIEMPNENTIVFVYCGFPDQILTFGGTPVAELTPPLVVSMLTTNFYTSELLPFNLFFGKKFRCGEYSRTGCANKRLSLTSLPLIGNRLGPLGGSDNLGTLHGYYEDGVFQGAFLHESEAQNEILETSGGGCVWIQNNTRIVSSRVEGSNMATVVHANRLINGTDILFLQFESEEGSSLSSSISTPNNVTSFKLPPGFPNDALSPERLTQARAAWTIKHAPNLSASSFNGSAFFAWLQQPLQPTPGLKRQQSATMSKRILNGGIVSNPTSAPYQCMLLGLFSFCTCWIIDEWHVGTAAHCVPMGEITLDPALVRPYYIFTGSTKFLNGDGLGTVTTARRSSTHPTALETLVSNNVIDFAVVRLDTPLAFSTRQQPIPYIRQRKEQSRLGDLVTVVGWGQINESPPTYPLDLRTYSPRIVSENVNFQDPNAVRKLAARADNIISSACHGDSGSPVTKKNEHTGEQQLVGVLIRITGADCTNSTAIYLDITETSKWLDQRDKLKYTTMWPHPPLPLSSQSGQLAVHVVSDDTEDGNHMHKTTNRRKAIVAATNTPTMGKNSTPKNLKDPRIQGVVFTFGEDGAPACVDIGGNLVSSNSIVIDGGGGTFAFRNNKCSEGDCPKDHSLGIALGFMGFVTLAITVLFVISYNMSKPRSYRRMH